MTDLATSVLDRLIDKTFENMDQDERLAFIEKLFLELPPSGQERVLRSLLVERREKPPARMMVLKWDDQDLQPQEIGPWMACCRMMVKIDQAGAVETLDTGAPARIFSALADETRIKIVKLLMEGEMRVEELTQALDTAQSTVSHHLRILKEAELVHGDRRGRSIYYSLARPLVVGE
jgi:hypothetical protein